MIEKSIRSAGYSPGPLLEIALKLGGILDANPPARECAALASQLRRVLIECGMPNTDDPITVLAREDRDETSKLRKASSPGHPGKDNAAQEQ